MINCLLVVDFEFGFISYFLLVVIVLLNCKSFCGSEFFIFIFLDSIGCVFSSIELILLF